MDTTEQQAGFDQGSNAARDSAESPEAEKKQEQLILLAPSVYLTEKIEREGHTPRIMETAKDESGNILIRKYEKLTKPVWKKFKIRRDCRAVHFICETPLTVIEGMNVSLLLPDDLQFMGVCFAQAGNFIAADQFFNEAMKSGEPDAFINAGVFRYRLGERGVIDNFSLAKRHFQKALGLLHLATQMPADEKAKRRKLCNEVIDEIDYRFASFLEKFFKFLIRLMTFRFSTEVHYIGGAAPAEPAQEKLDRLSESLVRVEFGLKVEAMKRLISDLHMKIPADAPNLAEELTEIAGDYANPQTLEILDMSVQRLSEFYGTYKHIFERTEDAAPAAPANPQAQTVQDMCFQMASYDEILKAADKYKLRSVGELGDLAANPRAGKAILAWLALEKLDVYEVMERLHRNPEIPEELKHVIRQRHGLLPDAQE